VEDGVRGSSTEDLERLLATPKKKKLTTTSQYIYQNLFQAGRGGAGRYHREGFSGMMHRFQQISSELQFSVTSDARNEKTETSLKLNLISAGNRLNRPTSD
jgi:hypothetical protein